MFTNEASICPSMYIPKTAIVSEERKIDNRVWDEILLCIKIWLSNRKQRVHNKCQLHKVAQGSEFFNIFKCWKIKWTVRWKNVTVIQWAQKAWV